MASLTDQAHAEVQAVLGAADVAIDATVGNGHDTLFLAQTVGQGGQVFGFDCQAQAIANTQQRLLQAGVLAQVQLIHGCHAQLAAQLPMALHGRVKAIMFNLGYLPGGDKSLITQADTTLAALDAASRLLAPGGVITVLAYPGHAGGTQETACLQQWCNHLEGEGWQVTLCFGQSQQAHAPRLFVLRRGSDLL
jgi:predicted methyltransferase